MLLLLGMLFLVLSFLLVMWSAGRRAPRTTGVAGGIEAIETVYSGRPVPDAAEREESGLTRSVLRASHGLALRLSRPGKVERLQIRLDIAGNPGRWTPERMLSFKGLSLLGGGLLGALLGVNSGPAALVLFMVALPAFGFFLPDILLYNAGIKRQDEISRALPDLLDLLGVSVQAGLGFDAALTRVALALDGPLAREMGRLLQEMRLGTSREEALKAMADRTSVDELRSFVAALVQAAGLGIPVGHILREQANELRIKRRQTAEERAQKVSVKITFPVVVCIMPALFVIVLAPGIMSMIDSGVFG